MDVGEKKAFKISVPKRVRVICVPIKIIEWQDLLLVLLDICY
jgi:hypothetical protein